MIRKTLTKKEGPFLAFNDAFFDRHQRTLLWLLNAPIIKRWARWVLRIRHADCSLETAITDIHANRFSFGDRLVRENDRWHLVRTTDFRTHPKFGKRIYFAFRPVWWLMHFWDWALADRLLPALSFGFDTLTAYPAAGANSPVDGVVQTRNNATWDLAHDDTNGNDALTSDATFQSPHTNPSFWRIARTFILFDTSSLSGTVTAATLSVYVSGVTDGDADAQGYVGMVQSSPAATNTLATTDFNDCGAVDNPTQGATAIDLGSFTTSAYNDFVFNSTGLTWIDIDGITKLGLREGHDIEDAEPTAGNSITMSFADQTGTSEDPKLVVTYTVPTKTVSINDTVTVSESRSVDIISRHIQPGETRGVKIIG